jgi:hypothetical protein
MSVQTLAEVCATKGQYFEGNCSQGLLNVSGFEIWFLHQNFSESTTYFIQIKSAPIFGVKYRDRASKEMKNRKLLCNSETSCLFLSNLKTSTC